MLALPREFGGGPTRLRRGVGVGAIPRTVLAGLPQPTRVRRASAPPNAAAFPTASRGEGSTRGTVAPRYFRFIFLNRTPSPSGLRLAT